MYIRLFCLMMLEVGQLMNLLMSISSYLKAIYEVIYSNSIVLKLIVDYF